MHNKYSSETVDEIRLRADTERMSLSTALWIGIGPVTFMILALALLYISVMVGVEFYDSWLAGQFLMIPAWFMLVCGMMSMYDMKHVPVDTSRTGYDESFVKGVWQSYFTAEKLAVPVTFLKGYLIALMLVMGLFVMFSADSTIAVFRVVFFNGAFILLHTLMRALFVMNIVRSIERIRKVRERFIFQM